MARKKIWFDSEDDQHARFRLQLDYDGLTQKQFFRLFMDSYIEHDEQLVSYINMKVKHRRKKSRQERIDKQNKKQKAVVEDFALNEDEIKNIFDIIASEDPDI